MNNVQIAVVGGGPAGLSASIAAARAGARVVLFDENRSLGGQLRYRSAELSDLDPPLNVPPRLAAALSGDARDAGVDLRLGATVWGLFAGPILAVADATGSYQLQPEQIVLATGSTDLPFPFPGGSLPGVLTARAVQILLHLHHVLPGRRFAVIGSGDAAEEVSRDIVAAGGAVVARLAPDRHGPNLIAEGDDGIRAIGFAGERHEVDTIVVAVGRQPDAELALMVECDAGYSPALGGFVPLRDAELRTSLPGILVAGDVAGICDVATALAEGRFAGLSAAAALGLISDTELDEARADFAGSAFDRIATVSGLSAVPARA
ncbi:MAG TPA: FAD-dependent oxidoreductase [Thermomicrobiales bacterium]|jgi:sarcosine oxidase subunit alpha